MDDVKAEAWIKDGVAKSAISAKLVEFQFVGGQGDAPQPGSVQQQRDTPQPGSGPQQGNAPQPGGAQQQQPDAPPPGGAQQWQPDAPQPGSAQSQAAIYDQPDMEVDSDDDAQPKEEGECQADDAETFILCPHTCVVVSVRTARTR